MIIQQGSLVDALFMTALGMAVVFIVLIAICYIIVLMGKIFDKKPAAPAAPAAPEAPAAAAEPQMDQVELIAVITAAVAASMRGGSASKLPLTVAPYTTSSSWSAASKNENTQKL